MRQPSATDLYYSGNKLALERELSLLLEAAPTLEIPRPIRAIISPHANYTLSGGVASRAYRQILDSTYKTVVVIAPSHHDEFNFSSIYSGEGYRTPLGEIPIARNLAEHLTHFHPHIRFSESGHSAKEYALEVQLPFLQWTSNKFFLIPIVMGEQTAEQIDVLYQAIINTLPKNETLIVASSDLSQSFSDSKARALDQVAQNDIENFDPDKLLNDIENGRTEMCGYGPVITAMKVAKHWKALDTQVLLYRNSGDITGERENVVGYLSALIF